MVPGTGGRYLCLNINCKKHAAGGRCRRSEVVVTLFKSFPQALWSSAPAVKSVWSWSWLCSQMHLSSKWSWDVTALESAVRGSHKHHSKLHHVCAPRGATLGGMSLNRTTSPGNTENREERRRRRTVTLGEIVVSCHTSYDRQKPALKLPAFTHTQLLLLFWSWACSVLAHKKNDKKYEIKNLKKKKISIE